MIISGYIESDKILLKLILCVSVFFDVATRKVKITYVPCIYFRWTALFQNRAKLMLSLGCMKVWFGSAWVSNPQSGMNGATGLKASTSQPGMGEVGEGGRRGRC